MKISSFSAPGSVILSGEYAMLFGKPAIACAINSYITVSCKKNKVHGPIDKKIQFIRDEIKEYLRKHNQLHEDTSWDFRISSDIPVDDVFGYNSAETVAITALMLKEFSQKHFSNEEIPGIAYQIEKKIHKIELGLHSVASTYGGLIYYRKEFEFLKHISSLNMKIPKVIEQNLFFLDTGKAEETNEELENSIGKEYNTNTKKIEMIFQHIEKTTKRFVISIIKEDALFFKQCIEENEQLLEQLGVVSAFTKKLIREIEKKGATKIIGNGGRKKRSGLLLVYSQNESNIKNIAQKYKISYFPFRQSIQGLTQNNK